MSRTYDELLADYHELQRSFLDICQKYAADVETARQQGRDEGFKKVLEEIASYDLGADEFDSYYNYRGIVTIARKALDKE